MKKLFLFAAAMLICMAVSAQSMKMVVDSNGEVVGRLIKVNKNTYTVGVQDDYDVPKKGNHIETFSAAKGQGVVFRKSERTGNINIRKSPDIKSAVVGKIPDTEDIPDVYDCLGKVNNWYKIMFDKNKVGYVRDDMVEWDGMCTF